MTGACVRHTCALKIKTITDTPLVVETAPFWMPWAVVGILALAGMATLGLRTSHEALARDRVIRPTLDLVAPFTVQPSVASSLIEGSLGLPDQADRS